MIGAKSNKLTSKQGSLSDVHAPLAGKAGCSLLLGATIVPAASWRVLGPTSVYVMDQRGSE